MSTPFLDDPLGRLAGGVRSLLHHPGDGPGRLPDEGALPYFSGATGWLHTEPLTPEALRKQLEALEGDSSDE